MQQTESNRATNIRGLDTVRVKKSTLVDKLVANRTIHIGDYNTAMEGYKAELTKYLKNNLKHAKQQLKNVDLYVTTDKQPTWHNGMSTPLKPVSHEDDYNSAIEMLEMSIDEEIELDQYEFKQYVRDDWDWKQQFTATNSYYSGGTLFGKDRIGHTTSANQMVLPTKVVKAVTDTKK